ncbi:Uncharacterized protein Fot_07027 [Forsythia ovata]|uniref:Uncharacterized protein n=1 Tax=Forsythia ovata TaxID=205694 RepID=A0ABD1WUN0_9LAMI
MGSEEEIADEEEGKCCATGYETTAPQKPIYIRHHHSNQFHSGTTAAKEEIFFEPISEPLFTSRCRSEMGYRGGARVKLVAAVVADVNGLSRCRRLRVRKMGIGVKNRRV